MARLGVAAGALILPLVTVIAGCSPKAAGERIDLDLPSRPEAAARLTGEALLAIVRYPAGIDQAALRPFGQAYAAAPLDGDGGIDPDSYQDAKAMIARTVDFALDLSDALQVRLPPGTVVLEPLSITTGGGRLVTRSLIADTLPPAAVTIDFLAYTTPLEDQLMTADGVTFGDLFAPVVLVHTQPSGSPATHGILAVTDALLDPPKRRGGPATTRATTSHAFVSYLNGGTDFSGLDLGSGDVDLEDGEVYALPLANFELDENLSGRTVARELADLTVALLHRIDLEAALEQARGEYHQVFDQDAGRRSGARARAALGKLEDVERRWLSERLGDLRDLATTQGMRARILEMRRAEVDFLNARRELASEQDQSIAIGMFMGAMTGMSAGMVGSVNPYAAQGMQFAMNDISAVGGTIDRESLRNTLGALSLWCTAR